MLDKIKKLDDVKKINAVSTPQTTNYLWRVVFFVLGALFFGLGVVGLVLPVLPTTPFMLLAAACWAKSSQRFHAWLLSHPVFGRYVLAWQERRAIPRRAKYLSWTMMGVSCVVLFYRLPKHLWWLAVLVSLVCLCVAMWTASLPDD